MSEPKADWSPSPQDKYLDHLEGEMIRERRRMGGAFLALIDSLREQAHAYRSTDSVIAATCAGELDSVAARIEGILKGRC